jgi:LL-diaminopimelate aminotransferase
MLAATLRDAGFQAQKPKASFFLYTRAPRGIVGGARFENGEAFSQYLIREKLICTVPWDDAGPYVRFSATFEAASLEEEQEVIAEIGRRVSDVTYEF